MGSLVVATSPPPTRLSVLPLRQVVTHRCKGHLHRHTVLENGRHRTARAQAWSFLGPFLLPAPPGFDSPAFLDASPPATSRCCAPAERSAPHSLAPRGLCTHTPLCTGRPAALRPAGVSQHRSPTDPSVCSGDTSSTAGAPTTPDPGLTMDLLTD